MSDSSQAAPVAVIAWGEPAAAGANAPRAPTPQSRAQAQAALEAGGVIALPTETVYGLAVRGDDARALAKLRAIKSRESSQALTWHVGDARALDRLPRVSPMVRRLMERYWPGPLTLVLPCVPRGLEGAAQDGWIGVRQPAHSSTADWLAGLPFPVVATSANRRGLAALSDAAAIAREFAGELDLVLDGGTPRLGEASLVLKLGPRHFDVLRPGLIDLPKLRDTAGLRITFVCTGNTCRSPMAAALANFALSRRLDVPAQRLSEFGFEVGSVGVAAGFDAPIARHAAVVLEELDKSMARAAREHRAQPAIPEDLAAADRVYALTGSHLEVLRSMLPPGRARHTELLDPSGADVPDPIGSDLSEYRRCRDHLAQLVERRLEEWA
jgi:tRNA threonylcarbamoyl adenosine modification protein (Sua5/YciO/YrdC/YwlC family)